MLRVMGQGVLPEGFGDFQENEIQPPKDDSVNWQGNWGILQHYVDRIKNTDPEQSPVSSLNVLEQLQRWVNILTKEVQELWDKQRASMRGTNEAINRSDTGNSTPEWTEQ